MEMNEFKILVKGLKAVYTSERFLPDADSIKIWYQMLGDLDYRTLSLAIQQYMMTEKFPPTIADLRELANKTVHGELPDWGESWETVMRAIRKYGTYGELEAMASFEGITKECVQRLGFRNLCLSENINMERANFRMIYEQLAERKARDSQISPKVLGLVDEIRQHQLRLMGE